MTEKILRLLGSSISVKARKLKCRKSRAVTGFLPPPGGPMEQMKFTSTRRRKSPKTYNGAVIATNIATCSPGGYSHVFTMWRNSPKTYNVTRSPGGGNRLHTMPGVQQVAEPTKIIQCHAFTRWRNSPKAYNATRSPGGRTRLKHIMPRVHKVAEQWCSYSHVSTRWRNSPKTYNGASIATCLQGDRNHR